MDRYLVGVLASLSSLVPASAGAEALQPYQFTRAINVSSCSGNQCVVSFPVVPSGKRLVVTSVSAQLGSLAGPITLEGNGLSYFVPKLAGADGYVLSQITVYFDPSSKPSARVFAPAGSPNVSVAVTLVGNLIAAQ